MSIVVVIDDRNFYIASEVAERNRLLFSGCLGRNIRKLPEKKNLAERDFMYAKEKKGVWEASSPEYNRAKLLISKEWTDRYLADEPIDEKYPSCPPEIELDEDDMFRDNQGNLFQEFCKNGNTDKAREYIEQKKITDLNYDDGYFALVAARNNQVEILNLLAEKGADLHSGNESALWAAAHNGYLECVRFLVEEQKADISKIKNTTAYTNKKNIKDYFEETELKRNVSSKNCWRENI